MSLQCARLPSCAPLFNSRLQRYEIGPRSLKLINLMGSALTAIRDTWDRLKSKLTDAERQAAREQVEAPLQPIAKAPVSRGFQP